MTDWPTTLPPPQLSSFQETPPNNLIRTGMDVGPDKVRRRTTADVRAITFVLALSKAEVAILDAFYNTTTFSGLEPFNIEHPRTEATVVARFVEPPQYQEREGVVYMVNISLEILP